MQTLSLRQAANNKELQRKEVQKSMVSALGLKL